MTADDSYRPRLFLGGPFEGLLTPDGSGIHLDHRRTYQGLISAFESAGYDVFSAHRDEGWGREMLAPLDCTPRDFEAVSACDVFVAIPGDPPSLGTHVEIGWASALGKPLVLLTEANAAKCALVRGIASVAEVEWVNVAPAQEDFTEVVDAARRVLARRPNRSTVCAD